MFTESKARRYYGDPARMLRDLPEAEKARIRNRIINMPGDALSLLYHRLMDVVEYREDFVAVHVRRPFRLHQIFGLVFAEVLKRRTNLEYFGPGPRSENLMQLGHLGHVGCPICARIREDIRAGEDPDLDWD